MIQRHYKGVMLFLAVMVSVLLLSFGLGYPAVAYGAGILAFGTMFVFGIAYMRPAGRSPEHHAKVDAIVNDTEP
jgi:hypothetical protein